MKHLQIVFPILVPALLMGKGLAEETPANGSSETDFTGPPSAMPGPVPDYVGDILTSIQEFIDGGMDGNLSAEVSVTAGNGAAGGS